MLCGVLVLAARLGRPLSFRWRTDSDPGCPAREEISLPDCVVAVGTQVSHAQVVRHQQDNIGPGVPCDKRSTESPKHAGQGDHQPAAPERFLGQKKKKIINLYLDVSQLKTGSSGVAY